jgi:hypothetical protein
MEGDKNKDDNNNEEIISEYKKLAAKCYDHIENNKLVIINNNINIKIKEIEEDKLTYYINNDVLKRFMIARNNEEKVAFEMWKNWLVKKHFIK